VLIRLKDDVGADDRFDVLLELAAIFSKLPREGWGYSRAEISAAAQAIRRISDKRSGPRLPAALCRWYECVGRVQELTASQNRLHPPYALEWHEEVLILYTEAQHCACWGIRAADLAQDDPPIVYSEGNGWNEETDALSRFALTVGLSELCISGGDHGCAGMVDDEALASLRSSLHSVPVQTLKWPSPSRPSFFLADENVLVLFESEFIFAAGFSAGIESCLEALAAPQHIEWPPTIRWTP
jgi:hypothetical protein